MPGYGNVNQRSLSELQSAKDNDVFVVQVTEGLLIYEWRFKYHYVVSTSGNTDLDAQYRLIDK